MLEKIVQIKNVGCFRNYSAIGDVSFHKLTLVYAENGRGKTTFCAILRSLQTGQPEFIAERKTLAATDPALVHIRINGANFQFTNNAWTATYPDVVIFDPVFVNDNVYSGDYVDHEHRKNLYRAIVGAQGVQLATQIEDLDGQIRNASTDLRTKKESVSRTLPPEVTLEDYLQWQPVADIETLIQQKANELSNRQLAAAKSSEIQAKGLFANIHLPDLPSDFTTVIAKQLTDIAADAEAKVRQQIAQHQMGHQGETWLSQGLEYISNDRCPFCGQEVRSNALLAAYRSHFNAAYRNLKQEVAQLSQCVNSAIGEPSLSSVQQAISGNAALAEFWKQFITVDLPDISFPDIQRKYASLREHCLALAKKKQDNPMEPVAPDADFSFVFADVKALRQVVQIYNAAVDISNTRIAELKDAVRRDSDIVVLKGEMAQLETKKRRFDSEVVQACQSYQNEMSAKASLEQRKEATRQQLDQYCQDILKTYEQSINNYLDQFNTGFRIKNTRHLYTGGTPSSHYQIEINSTAVDLGDQQTPPGTPCFKTTLSSGDRSALALAFFLAISNQDPDIVQKIVVLDDPFTSLDRFRRTCTQQLIQRLTESAKQVIVLSHDPNFLKLLWDECPSANANVKTLQMSKAGDTTVIGEWNIEAETQSIYDKDHSTLLAFYRERKGNPRDVARTIRPFLEGTMRRRFPGHFQSNEWLGEFISKIRDADSTNFLTYAKAYLDELEAINGYSKKYHHQQNANFDSEPMNDDELYAYVKRTLKLVSGD